MNIDFYQFRVSPTYGRHRRGYVYAAFNPLTGLIKIGCTSQHPSERISQISRQVKARVELIAITVVENKKSFEADLHAVFAKYRIFGEWFDLNELAKADLLQRLELK